MIAAPADDDIGALASNLVRDDEGIWQARQRSTVDYPDEGNAFCFQVEDGSFWFRHRNACILDLVRRHPPSGPIADIGGGNGFVARGLEQHGFPTLLIEPGRAGIANARSRGLTRLVWSAFGDAGFASGALHAAGLFDVLEHVPDDIGFLRELARTLTPGGRLYLTVPAYEALWSLEDDIGGHHRRYSLGQLERTVRAAGFTLLHGTYFFALLPLPILAVRTIPYRVFGRREIDREKVEATLQPTENAITRLVDRILAREAAWLRTGRRLPFGASVLLAAERNTR